MEEGYKNMTKKGLLEELKMKEKSLIYINREINTNTQIIKGYFDDIADKKELLKRSYQEFNDIDNLKWKTLIINKSRELQSLYKTKKDIESHITAIKDNLSTYDIRWNKKFGRKSPFIVMDFGYDINLKVI